MAFWGLEILPGKPMPLNLTRRLVVKQAALVVSKPAKKTEPCVLSVCCHHRPLRRKPAPRTESRAIRACLQCQWSHVASPHSSSHCLSLLLCRCRCCRPRHRRPALLLVPIAPPPPHRRCRSRRTSSATSSAGCTRACSSSARWSCPSRQATRRRFRAPSRHFRDTSEALPRHFQGAGSERPRCQPRYCPRYAAASELHAATAALAAAALRRPRRRHPPPLPPSAAPALRHCPLLPAAVLTAATFASGRRSCTPAAPANS